MSSNSTNLLSLTHFPGCLFRKLGRLFWKQDRLFVKQGRLFLKPRRLFGKQGRLFGRPRRKEGEKGRVRKERKEG